MKQTEWTDRWIIFVQMNRLGAANGFAKAWDPDVAGDETFGGTILSVTGNEPATWTACNTAAKQNMTVAINNALGNVPWAKIYDAHEWSWQDCLDDMKLKEIIPDEIQPQHGRIMDVQAAPRTVNLFGRDVPISTHVWPFIQRVYNAVKVRHETKV